jgi:hypothetical protein
MACKTINKIGTVSKTPRDSPLDLPGPKRLHPEGDRLQICWPGLQKYGGQGCWPKKTAKSFAKANEPKTRYCGHLLSRLSHDWTWSHIRAGDSLYMGDGWSQRGPVENGFHWPLAVMSRTQHVLSWTSRGASALWRPLLKPVRRARGSVEDPFTWRAGFWGGVSLGEAKGGVVEVLKGPAKPFRKNEVNKRVALTLSLTLA